MNKKILILSIFTLIIDQVTKHLAYVCLNGELVIIPGFFKLNYATNNGAAYSILSNHRLFLIIISIIIFYILYKFSTSFKGNIKNNIAFGLLYGGILGNLLNRIINGYVIDFLDFNIFGYDFPIFNFADISIVLAVFLLIIAIIKGEDNEDSK